MAPLSVTSLWLELVDGMEYHVNASSPADGEENFLADPGWVEDLERYCFLTEQREDYVLSELRHAAVNRLNERAYDRD